MRDAPLKRQLHKPRPIFNCITGLARLVDRSSGVYLTSGTPGGHLHKTVRLDSQGKRNCALPPIGPLPMQHVSSAVNAQLALLFITAEQSGGSHLTHSCGFFSSFFPPLSFLLSQFLSIVSTLLSFDYKMARTAIGKRPWVSTSDKGKQKALPKQAQHKDFKSRFSNFLRRPWIIERGIDVESFVQTPVPHMVTDRGWGGYVARPPRPNRGIVTEYYASVVPGRLLVGEPVLVQGVEILTLIEGEWLQALGMDGQAEWGTLVKLYQRDMHADVAFWNLFLTYSLMPSQHRSEIFYDQARVLLRLRSGGPINIGRVIFNAIQDASAHDDQSMVFPCLITAFCRQAGIDVSAGLENHDPSMMNLTNWNQQLVLRGLPPIGNYGERKRRREEREAREAEAAALLQDQPQGAPQAPQIG
ncbi:hypothetical protein LWI29_031003 [Acer saccharum]|uniref:Putative plant transposon protein domain-containing protein n=1 Tax=Acer saccharum TaxID=4024 RepID=A0AA39RJB6_ACESA|nr:hypothetical protein LWI29_031003 [Acer saccharum]